MSKDFIIDLNNEQFKKMSKIDQQSDEMTFLIEKSHNQEIKNISNYNDVINESNLDRRTFTEKLQTLSKALDKSEENKDSFQIWLEIPSKDGANDNQCLAGNNVGEALSFTHESKSFCLIEFENDEIFIDNLLFDPTQKDNPYYLITPDEIIDNLYIELNNIERSFDFIERYSISEKTRLINNEVSRDEVAMKNHIENGGIIFDTCLEMDILFDLQEVVDIVSKENTAAFLNESLYRLGNKGNIVTMYTDKRILENQSFLSELKDELGLQSENAIEIKEVSLDKSQKAVKKRKM
jgi:hypothetical protein